MLSAIVVDAEDNVATALCNLDKGETINLGLNNGASDVVLREAVAFGHKLALKEIKEGESVIKYGEIIGRAVTGIAVGEHVHVHNVEGLKGRGDKN